MYDIGRPYPESLLVVSGDMYNQIPNHPWVLAMPVIKAPDKAMPPFFIKVGEGFVVETDTVSRYPKRLLTPAKLPRVDTQTMTDIDNALFKILATA